jgi:small-conductance mechanosensitive channel
MFLFRHLFLLLMLALGSHAAAGSPDPAPGKTAAATSALTLGNRDIVTFRGTLAGYTPKDRAEAAQRRLRKAMESAGNQQVSTRSIAEGTQVLLDGHLLFLVTPGDVNALAGDTTDELAAESARQLKEALVERNQLGDPDYMLMAAGLCIAATAAYAALLRAISVLQRRMRIHMERLLSRRLKRVRIRNVALLEPEHYLRFVRHVFGALMWAVRLLATFVWIAFLLGRIPSLRGWGGQLQQFLVDTALQAARSVGEAIPGLVLVLVIAVLARLAILTIRSVLGRVESGELHLGWIDRDTAVPTRRLANIAVILFALAMAYPYLPGSHTAGFQGVTVLAGLMVSIGASSIVAQGASGLILMYTRSLRPGEYVRIGDAEGTVIELGMFQTRLRTGLGSEIAMPNAWVLTNTTRNFSRASSGADYVVDTAVTIGYDTPWRLVHEILKQAAARTAGLLASPAPYVAQASLSDFYIEYRLVAHAGAASARARVEVLSVLHQNIVDGFERHGIAMTSPHFTQEPHRPNRPPPAPPGR